MAPPWLPIALGLPPLVSRSFQKTTNQEQNTSYFGFFIKKMPALWRAHTVKKTRGRGVRLCEPKQWNSWCGIHTLLHFVTPFSKAFFHGVIFWRQCRRFFMRVMFDFFFHSWDHPEIMLNTLVKTRPALQLNYFFEPTKQNDFFPECYKSNVLPATSVFLLNN